MSLHRTLLAVSLLASQLVIVTSAASGQTPAGDTTPPSPSDSQPALTDSAANTAASIADSAPQLPGSDSVSAGDTATANDSASSSDSASVADSASARDSTRSASDSLLPEIPAAAVGVDTPQSAPDTTRPAGAKDSTKVAATAPPQRVDSVLKAACGGPDGTLPIARDLLVVVFAPEAGRAERAAVARSAKGKLVGEVSGTEPGAYYLRVPTGGEEHRLRAVADELTRSGLVRQVGSRTCPSLPPADTARSSPPISRSPAPSVSVPPQ